MTSVTDSVGGTTTYTYDALNQRIAKTVGTQTTRFVYDRGNVYLEFSGDSATPNTRYLYGPMVDQVLAQETNNGSTSTTTWLLGDNQGSVRDLVNNSGSVVNHFTYDSFGNVLSSTGTVDTRYKYTGRELDGETGLYYYRARYYDAGVGRFIGQDPLGFGAKDNNLYRYVGNCPSNHTDPSGLLVDATFTLSTGNLKVVDRTTKKTTIVQGLFSGAPDYRNNFIYERIKGNGPIPRGEYEILLGGYDDESKTYWFRLDRVDNHLRDDKDDFTGRGNYRLHPGTISEGCITLDKKREKDWLKLYRAVVGTITEEVPENRDLKSLFVTRHLGLASIIKFGDLTVKQ
ncbi:DUF2778 domain-containing protein (plasmid) [Kovacikia minuta CCNUW1]|nr:RHS repeat-associated core domain-containing protein [Kovacikia minuta]UBF30100.1 DUF2778 domain-containing protein [Kovacikia minuta CCNUW1]